MWQWLKDIWLGPTTKVASDVVMDSDLSNSSYRDSASDRANTKAEAASSAGLDVRSVFMEATREAALERAELEANLLTSGKIQEYFKSTVRYASAHAHQDDGANFFLMSNKDAGVPTVVFMEYCDLFIKTVKEFGVEASITGQYLRIDREPFRKAMKRLIT